jgi:hypothetical protein
LHGGLHAALVTDAGTLPGFGLGAAFGVSFGGEWIHARVLGTFLPPRAASAASRPGSALEFDLLAGALALCAPVIVRASRLSAGACLGGELGVLSVKARGLSVSRRGDVLWRAGRLDLDARWALSDSVSIDLMLSALAPFERHRFVVEEFHPGFVGPWYSQATVHRPLPVIGRAGVGLSIAFDGGE